MSCEKCNYNDKSVTFYPDKTVENITFFGRKVCDYCFQAEMKYFWEYKAYLTLIRRYAHIHCPDFIKEQFIVAIEFLDKPIEK